MTNDEVRAPIELCIHAWLIEAPNGSAELRGFCKKCNEERTFPAVPTPTVEYMRSSGKPSFNNAPLASFAAYDNTYVSFSGDK